MWHLHRAERADALVHALGELLAEPLEVLFASEVVAVPALGGDAGLDEAAADLSWQPELFRRPRERIGEDEVRP